MSDISTQPEKKQGNPNPSPETRFGGPRANPSSPGGWDKTESISYQYNRLMRMNPDELEAFVPETVAQKIALTRIKAAQDSKFGLADTKEITDRVEGKAPQAVDLTSGGEKINNPIALLTVEELRKLAGK